MTREEHRDRIKKAQSELNTAMGNAAADGYNIVLDTLELSLITGGSYPVVTVSTMEVANDHTRKTGKLAD